MAKLLGTEVIGHRIERDYLHYGDDGRKKITTVIEEDVEPIFRKIKDVVQNPKKSDLRLKASIPFTLLDEESKKCSKLWGVSLKDAFSEIVSCKTDRSQKVIRKLTEDLDFKKLQARNY